MIKLLDEIAHVDEGSNANRLTFSIELPPCPMELPRKFWLVLICVPIDEAEEGPLVFFRPLNGGQYQTRLVDGVATPVAAILGGAKVDEVGEIGLEPVLHS